MRQASTTVDTSSEPQEEPHVPCPARTPRRRPRRRRRRSTRGSSTPCPAKRRPGYANFAVAEPPLKLVLLEGEAGEPTRMDHLGVEVASTDEVTAATVRLADAGLATRVEDNTTCCYAVQDKVWVTGPGGEPWEVYTVTGDARPDLEGKTERRAVGRRRRRRHLLQARRAPTPTPASPPPAAEPSLPEADMAGSRAWISTRWPTSSTRCRPRTSSPCAPTARTRPRTTATRRWPRRSARCPSRRPPPGRQPAGPRAAGRDRGPGRARRACSARRRRAWRATS